MEGPCGYEAKLLGGRDGGRLVGRLGDICVENPRALVYGDCGIGIGASTTRAGLWLLISSGESCGVNVDWWKKGFGGNC